MYRIRRFGVMKTATVVAVMYMLIVAVFAIPFALLALLVAPSQGSGAAGVGVVAFALVAILIYGFLGWVFTAIAVAVYNLAARWVGGIEVEIETVAPPPPMPAWGTPGTPAAAPLPPAVRPTSTPEAPPPSPSTPPPPSTPPVG